MINENNLNREYKDRLFTFIFGREENREWTLSLYNAVNGSHYTDASLIEFNTLKDFCELVCRHFRHYAAHCSGQIDTAHVTESIFIYLQFQCFCRYLKKR